MRRTISFQGYPKLLKILVDSRLLSELEGRGFERVLSPKRVFINRSICLFDWAKSSSEHHLKSKILELVTLRISPIRRETSPDTSGWVYSQPTESSSEQPIGHLVYQLRGIDAARAGERLGLCATQLWL